MVDLYVVVEGNVFYFDSETRFEPSAMILGILQDVPMSLPLSEELDLLAEFRDVSW